MNNRSFYQSAGLSALGVLILTSGAFAQSNDSDSGGFAIEEIVVTAQKRAEDLQDVPLAITAFNASTMETQRIESISDVAARTPNLTYSSFGGNRPEFTIRGVGTAGAVRAALDNAVVLFLDEVYIPRSTASTLELFDLEQVSVLRGPQGTLFGKNVVGGAISLTTRKPSLDETVGKFKVSSGDFSLFEAQGYVSGPFSENVAGKFSFSRKTRDGFGRDIVTGIESDDLDSTYLRGQLLVDGEAVQSLISVDYSDDSNNGRTRSEFEGSGLSNISDTDPFTSAHGVPQFVETEQFGLSGKFTWETGIGEFTAISAYRTVDSESNESFFAEALGVSPEQAVFIVDEKADQFTQEVRLASNGERFNWVAGIYLNYEEVDRLACQDETTTDAARPFINGGAAGTGRSCFDQLNETTGGAVFWDGSWTVSESITLRTGFRYTSENKDSTNAAIAAPAFTLPDGTNTGNPRFPLREEYAIAVDKRFSGFTPRFVAEWRPTDEAMLYLSASRGFKAGGFDGQAPNAAGAVVPFENELAWNYELGLKSRWAQQRLQLNAVAFSTDFKNLQNLILVQTGGLAIVNAGKAEITGLELEIVAIPHDSLLISAGYGMLDAEFEEFFIVANGQDRSGRPIPNAPDNKFNVSATHSLDIGSGSSIETNVNYNWTDDNNFQSGDVSGTTQEAYGVVNGSISYVAPDARWKLSVWGKNLNDEVYADRIFTARGTRSIYAAPPRTYGVSFSYEF